MKQWKLAEKKFDDLIDQVLYNRGIFSEISEINKANFLKPDFSHLFDPFLMKGLKKATERIEKAQKDNEIVGIFADYDADGIPGAALLYKALTKIGIKAVVYIPSREGGYGLSNEGIDYLKNKKCSLIITVDLGIRNLAEALHCKKVGVYLIVTDHHTPDEKIPEADIVLNPKIKNDKYPFSELSGAGVAYKLIQGLSSVFPKEINESFLKWNLDLVAISTISDVVPLIGENRILASFGLQVLKKTKNLGLQKLYKVAKILPEIITAYNVGFQIAPRINAPGRMDHATKSFELLVTKDNKEAEELAGWLEEKNIARQKAMETTEIEAVEKIIENKLNDNRIIVVSGNWMKGVIGPVASRISEKFSRPAILFAIDDKFYSGSARSVEGVNILDLVEKSEQYLEKFGGHKGACGLTVSEKQYDDFLASIIKNANKDISDTQLQKKIKIDAEADMEQLNINLYDKIRRLEPFGMGNSKPVFMIPYLEVMEKRLVGADEKHCSIVWKKDSITMKSIFFNGNLNEEKIKIHNFYDVVFSLDLDTWQGRNEIKLNVVDVRTTKTEEKKDN